MGIQTRVLGRTGVPVTVLGYGAMELRGRPPTPLLSDAEVPSRSQLAAQPAEGAGRRED